MTQIDAYVDFKKYTKFQHCRPDYTSAISQSMKFAKRYSSRKNLVIGDFCCGTGSNTKKFADLQSIQKAILIDINKEFLEIAKNSDMNIREVVIHNSDVLDVDLKKECDLVFSIFAYHHIPDSRKKEYILQIRSCLKKGGVLILAEIYFNNKDQCLNYYDNLYTTIPKEKQITGLKKFLQQTAKSDDFEFKVSKNFADSQFKKHGFKLIEEIKIWPKKSNSELGTFVQIYRT